MYRQSFGNGPALLLGNLLEVDLAHHFFENRLLWKAQDERVRQLIAVGGDPGHRLGGQVPPAFELIEQSVDIDPGRVVVTSGSSGAFILSFTALFDAGDRVVRHPNDRLADGTRIRYR